MEIPKHGPNCTKPRKALASTLLSKSIPIMLMSFVMAVTFIPDVLKVLSLNLSQIYFNGLASVEYNSISIALCWVVLFQCTIALHSGMLAIKIWRKYRIIKAIERSQ